MKKNLKRILIKKKQKIIIDRIYEKMARAIIESYYRPLAEEFASDLKYNTILDLGTGPGYLPIEIANICPSVTVDGIDISRNFINMARENTVKAGVADRVHFEVGDIRNLQLEDSSYGMIIGTGVVELLLESPQVFNDCYDALKPGGKMWLFGPVGISQEDKKKWKAFLTLYERLFCRLFLFFHRVRSSRSSSMHDKEDATKIISATKFKKYWVVEEGVGLGILLEKQRDNYARGRRTE